MPKEEKKQDIETPKSPSVKIGYIAALIIAVIAGVGFFYWKSAKDLPDIAAGQPQNVNVSQNSNTTATVIAPSTGKEVEVKGVPEVAEALTAVTAKGAYEKLLAEAKKWKDDATLVNLRSDQDVALDGKSTKWEGFFISQSDHKIGWSAVFKDGLILGIKEQETSAKKLTEPAFTIDSGDAIKSGLGDLGASEVKVSSIRLFQETESGEWFWSVATDKGNITLKAK